MEHCRLAGLRDFNNSDPNGVVATTLYAWIRDLVVNYTIDGLRIDTTPYVPQAVWQKFEAAAGVYAVGEVDDSSIAFVAPWQAPTGTQAALTGILSYPLFATMRSVFQQRNSMRQLGDAWRASIAAYANVGALGVFVDNHDNARFLNGANRDVGTFRAALAYAILSEGVPITYYGSEWLYAGESCTNNINNILMPPSTRVQLIYAKSRPPSQEAMIRVAVSHCGVLASRTTQAPRHWALFSR